MLLGLAGAVKVTALVVVPFAVLAALVGPYRIRALVRDGLPVVGGALVAVAGATLARAWTSGGSPAWNRVAW